MTFPYICPYKNGYNTEYSQAQDDAWLPVMQWENNLNYFKSLEVKKSTNPLYIKANGKPCVVCNAGVCTGVSCSERHNGICFYERGYDICDAYDDVCQTESDCGIYSSALHEHFCDRDTNLIRIDECAQCDDKFYNYENPRIEIKLVYNLQQKKAINVTLHSDLKLMPVNALVKYQCFGDFSNNGVYLYNLMDIADNSFIVNSQIPAYYWCEAFLYPDFEVVRSNVILVDDHFTYNFNFVIKLQASSDVNHNDIAEEIRTKIAVADLLETNIRAVALLPSESTKYNGFIFHITTYNSDYNLNETLSIITRAMDRTTFNYEYILNSRYCLAENTTTDTETIHWPETLLGKTVISGECYTARTCQGSFKDGASWSSIVGSCDPNIEQSEISDDLINMLNSTTSSAEKAEGLNQLVSNASEVAPFDILLVSKIMEDISSSNEEYSLNLIADSTSKMLDINRQSLNLAQEQFGATDRLLQSYDMAFNNSINVSTFI